MFTLLFGFVVVVIIAAGLVALLALFLMLSCIDAWVQFLGGKGFQR